MTQMKLQTLTEVDIKGLEDLPKASSCYRIDFESWAVVPGIVNGTYWLYVYGTKPWLSMDVTLKPLIYIKKPEYWGIEVVGCLHGIGLPVQAPYVAELDVTHFLGTKGIELIGATKNEKFAAP